MSGRQAAPRHVRGLRRCGPLIRVESGRAKKISGRCRIAPFAILKSGHIEMQEHSESQIHEPLLQLQEWQSVTQSRALRIPLLRCGALIGGQYRRGSCSSDQLEELSS